MLLQEFPMSMSQKAEVATEFIIFFSILLLFFVFFVGIIGVNSSNISESTVFASAGKILDTVKNEINTASRIEGYYKKFYIPENLPNGNTYNITYNATLGMIEIEWDEGKNLIGNIITSNITGNVSTGYNIIKNIEGKVNINEG